MRLLIVANDVVSRTMAGPGIRCYELGHQLSLAGHTVTIAGIGQTDLAPGEMTIRPPLSETAMEHLAASQDAVLLEGLALARYGTLRHLDLPLIVDLYDPFPLALLEQEALRPLGEQQARSGRIQKAIKDLLAVGDFFLCASERQRDLWIGSLLLANRINPDTWRQDSTLRRLIDVVPFGVSSASLPERRPLSREVMGPRVGNADLVLLWGGGIYNWFDPLTLLRAVARVVPTVPNLKLVFMSTSHPQEGVPERMWMPARTRELSDQLDLTDKHVIFHEGWVDYTDRGVWLAAADCGVSTHFDHAETRYSFRTRILDYIWAGLPIICTAGDVCADLVREQRLGWVVPAGDDSAIASAIQALASNSAERDGMAVNVRAAAARMTWPQVVEPLLKYCEAPTRAADSSARVRTRERAATAGTARVTAATQLFQVGINTLRTDGARAAARRAVRWWVRRHPH
ncbi:MAG: glycosyltransferase family 4 protein [Candidatus Dormibacteria bacterium]